MAILREIEQNQLKCYFLEEINRKLMKIKQIVLLVDKKD